MESGVNWAWQVYALAGGIAVGMLWAAWNAWRGRGSGRGGSGRR